MWDTLKAIEFVIYQNLVEFPKYFVKTLTNLRKIWQISDIRRIQHFLWWYASTSFFSNLENINISGCHILCALHLSRNASFEKTIEWDILSPTNFLSAGRSMTVLYRQKYSIETFGAFLFSFRSLALTDGCWINAVPLICIKWIFPLYFQPTHADSQARRIKYKTLSPSCFKWEKRRK